MKTIITVFLTLVLFATCLTAQETTEHRLAYSYVSSTFDKAIFEQLDKSKLSGKSAKMYEKSMKRLNQKTVIYFENYLREKLKEQGYNVMPLNAVGVMGNSALNLEGYPFIFFPKKTLKKHAEKDVADVFMSATLSVSKPLITVVGLKPEVTVSLKLFSKSGELINKVSAMHKPEKKISNMAFAVNQRESFDKMDYEHALILFEKVETIIQLATNDAASQLSTPN